MSILEYNVTRPIHLNRCWTLTAAIVALLAIVLVTLSNVVAVGYEFVSFDSTSFCDPSGLWYQRFLPTFLYPASRTCQGVALNLGDGKTVQEYKSLIIAISTHNRWTYTLSSYIDENGETPTDGLPYEGYILTNCSVNLISLKIPMLNNPVERKVCKPH